MQELTILWASWTWTVRARPCASRPVSRSRLVHSVDGGRIRLQRWCELESQPIPWTEVRSVPSADAPGIESTSGPSGHPPTVAPPVFHVRSHPAAGPIDVRQIDTTWYLTPGDDQAEAWSVYREGLLRARRICAGHLWLAQQARPALMAPLHQSMVLLALHDPPLVRAPPPDPVRADPHLVELAARQISADPPQLPAQVVAQLVLPTAFPRRRADMRPPTVQRLRQRWSRSPPPV